MIRLAVRCSPEQADLVLAELTVLAPNGVEEERGPGYVEYAIYGGEGELPELGSDRRRGRRAADRGSSAEIPDDWADRWRDSQTAAGRRTPLAAAELGARPRRRDRPGRRPGPSFRNGRSHPTTRLCLEYLLELADRRGKQGALVDLGTGSGVLAIAAAKLGWSPVTGYDHEPAAIEASASNASINDRRRSTSTA